MRQTPENHVEKHALQHRRAQRKLPNPHPRLPPTVPPPRAPLRRRPLPRLQRPRRLEHFEPLYQSVSSRLVYSQSDQLSLALFDSFQTYAHMYDSDFKFLKNRFFFHIAFYFPATPDLPELGQIRTGQPVNSFYYLPAHTPSTSAPCSNATKNVKSKTNTTCCSVPAPNTLDSPQVGYLYPTPANPRNFQPAPAPKKRTP